jgi:hypothetical protein
MTRIHQQHLKQKQHCQGHTSCQVASFNHRGVAAAAAASVLLLGLLRQMFWSAALAAAAAAAVL